MVEHDPTTLTTAIQEIAMATSTVGAERQITNPTFVSLPPALIAAVRAEMRRIEAAAEWRALVAECAARGDE